MEANKIQLRTLIICVVSIVALELGAKGLIPKGLYQPMFILGVVRLFEVILILLIVWVWGKGLSSIGLDRRKILSGLRKGLIWSACFGVAASLVFVFLFFVGINVLKFIRVELPIRSGDLILFFSVGGIVGPVAEEALFRGILYGFFRRWGMWVALLLSTVLFVLAHPDVSGIPLTQVVGGILFAVAFELTRSLMVPITIHCLGNLAIFSLSLVL